MPSYVGYQEDTGKEIYSYSDARAWIDFSPKQKRQMQFSLKGIYLIVLAILLSAWFFVSFVYRMVTESNRGRVALSMLPSFLIVGFCIFILLISFFGLWEKLLRWAIKHHWLHGRNPSTRARYREIEADIKRADLNKRYECAVEVTEKFVTISIYGQKYVFSREAVSVKVSKTYDELTLVFNIDGFELAFPKRLPENEFVPLNKVFGSRLQTVKSGTKKKLGFKYFINELPAIMIALIIVAAAALMTAAPYLWIPSFPPFLGIFFLLMSLLVFCNIFSEIPVVSDLGVPFAFSVVLLAIPPWAYVWLETQMLNNEITFFHVLTHCTPLAAGFGFFWILGFYVLAFAVSKAIDYARFGRSK
ncbi:MAG: hypothetical protein K2O41_05475 [Clostridia bacterium]|nr:hypothetical protein [Clostridia bacterium]